MDKKRGLPSLENNSIRGCITDPPYGIEYHSNRYKKGNPYSKIENDDIFCLEWIKEMNRILMDDCFLLVFSRWDVMDVFKEELKKYFDYKNLLIWIKNNHSAGDLKGNFSNQYEVILYFTRGRYLLKGHRHSNVFFDKKVNPEKYDHATIKPLNLIIRLLKTLQPTSIIDPFMGSGTTKIACERLGIKCMGYEIDNKYEKITKNRKNKTILQYS